jgi:glycerol-3-phosphate dehydrogenase (NAD(P)+)
MIEKKEVVVLGCGTWGTALAGVLADNDFTVYMWDPIKDFANTIIKHKKHPNLPDFEYKDNIIITTDASKLPDCRFVVSAIPSQYLRTVLKSIQYSFEDKIIISVSKGIENDTLLRMSEVIHSVTKIPIDNIAVLSGPSHAEEVARKMPTAVVSSCLNLDFARQVQNIFSNSYFRVYSSTDLIGVELGGSVKNVIAIAAGICDGAKFGDNTLAALLTRGISEITQLGDLMGANANTFSGLSGIGDLFVTANSEHSRNRFVGKKIGLGIKLSQILSNMNMVAEGVKTTKSVYDLSIKLNIEMPICEQVYKVLFEEKCPKDAITDLMNRPLIDENKY